MRQPRKRKGSPAPAGRPVHLTKDDRKALTECLGARSTASRRQAVRMVERWLGWYPWAVGELRSAEAAEEEKKRGRPRLEAREWLILELRRVFCRYCVVTNQRDHDRPAGGALSLVETREEAFVKRALRAGGIAIENPRRYFDTPRAAMPSVHADPNAVKASRDDPDNVEKRFKAMPIPARYKVRHGGRWGTSKDRAVGPDKRPPTVSLASMVASITKQEDEKYVPAQPIGPMIEIANKARMKRVREFYDRKFSGGLARLPVSALWNHLLNANRIEVEKFVISLVLCERNDAATGKRVRVLSQLEAQCKACDTAWIARKEGSDAGHEVKDATVLTCPSCKAEEIVEAALLRWAMEAIETVVLRERPQCS